METLSDELENTGIRVNAINPGATRTQMRARAYPSEDAMSLKTPKEIIAPWLFLMADESIGVTGQSINAQG